MVIEDATSVNIIVYFTSKDNDISNLNKISKMILSKNF